MNYIRFQRKNLLMQSLPMRMQRERCGHESVVKAVQSGH